MSSIDKYVEGEARSCNPNVRVVKIFGRIQGYIGSDKVFDIADRYGYLNDQERSIIQQGIRAHELQDEEYRRREAMRLENERIAMRTELRQSVNSARQALTSAYHSAMQSHAAAIKNLTLSASVAKMQGYNLEGYKARAEQLEQKVRGTSSKIEADYQAKLGALNSLDRSIDDNATTQVYAHQRQSLRRLSTTISGVTIPMDEVNQLQAELNKLEVALQRVKGIENELKRISDTGLSGSIAHNALQTIRSTSIGSLEDVDRLIGRVQGQLEDIRSAEFHKKTAERSDKLALLEGVARSCSQIRAYVVEQNYEATSYREEIVHAANQVLNAYTELRNAEYTTCSQEAITNACSVAQQILVGSDSEERALRALEKLLNDSQMYKRDDLLQADNYADYRSKTEELTSRGLSPEEIAAFDPLNYESQRLYLLDELLKQDVSEAISRTRTTFLMACKAMEDMGYAMLHYDMGDEEVEVDGVNDALACEATYVIPGCEGVVWRIVASDCNVNRKLVGVVRPDGRATPIETVREVAKKVEDSGEIGEFFSKYADSCGTGMTVTGAVDSDTEGSDEVIRNNCFLLDPAGEEYFDKLVASGDAAARQKWRTATPKQASAVVTATEKKGADRRKECSGCHQKLQAKRKK